MRRTRHLCRRVLGVLRRAWTDVQAAQIAEFALSLPLLVVFVVGIFDFSQALSVKQKLMNAARDGARVAAADPATDLSAALPVSVSDAYQVVDNYLLSEKINDCGLSGQTPTQTAGTLTWVSTSTGSGCPGSGITFSVNRGCKSTVTSGANTINLIATCVTISYAYKWEFNRVIGLLGGNAAGANSLTATAQAFNEN